MHPELAFHHAPSTRSSGVLVLLEELGAPYTLHLLNMKAGEQRRSAYLAINPMGKVPAITHGDALVTEQVARIGNSNALLRGAAAMMGWPGP